MRDGGHTIPLIPVLLGFIAMAALLLWAGWSFSGNIARISQGNAIIEEYEPSRAWSDTLA